MKKRILALLLAGLLTASLSSCISRTGDRGDSTDGGTEEKQTKPPVVVTTAPPVTETWKDVDEQVYVTVEKLQLRVETSTAVGAVEVSGATKLHRIKTSAAWSLVEYNGKQYYAQNASLTTDDLLGDGFTTCNPTKMYVNEKVNVRKYASATAAISTVIKTLEINDEVTVVAKSEKWVKIKYTNTDSTTSYYFVSAECLSSVNYNDAFQSCTDTQMYVIVDTVNLRSTPIADAAGKNIVGSRKKDDVVVVVAKGTGDFASWSKIKVADEVKEGDPQTYSYLYISSSCLSETKGGTAQTNPTLDQILTTYNTFTKCEEKTMYVLKGNSIKTRKTPVFEGEENVGVYLNEKTAVKVVATGTADSIACYIIQMENGEYHFVTTKYLTPNEDGSAQAPTLQEILAQYQATFEACTPKTVTATQKVNCYNTPTTSTTVPLTLEAGNQVTLVAVGKGNASIWCIIQTEDGTCYFAASGYFN